MKSLKAGTLLLAFLPLFCAQAQKSVAYIHGDIAADGTTPSGSADPYDQMLLSDTGSKGCSQFKAMVETEGYAISQHYDQTTTLNAAFLNQFDVLIFGLHQKLWSVSEKSALDGWLRAGGGILMYSDSAAGGHYGTVGINNPVGQKAVNNLLSQYGMEVTVDQGGGTRAYTARANDPNPVIWDQPVFEGEGVSPVAVDPAGPAEVLIPLDDAHKISGGNMNPSSGGITIENPVWAVAALCRIGQGNAIAIFDRQPMWNNGPGSDINEENNREVLRRFIRYLARDYGNSSEWISLTPTTNALELTYRQWRGGTGTPGVDYTARNTQIILQHSTSPTNGIWQTNANWVEHVSTLPESTETEFTTVRILADATNSARFARLAILPATNSPAGAIIAINCGGAAYSGGDAINYQTDRYFVGGHTDSFPGNAVANTVDDLLYNYARSGFSAYQIPVTNGNYTVRLKFSETYFTASSKRVFDLSLEGSLVINDLDLYATAPGKWVAYDLEFPVTVSDGILSITASASINNPLLNAIVVIPE